MLTKGTYAITDNTVCLFVTCDLKEPGLKCSSVERWDKTPLTLAA